MHLELKTVILKSINNKKNSIYYTKQAKIKNFLSLKHFISVLFKTKINSS